MTKIKEVISYLEKSAPPALQENYDNSGLIVGDRNAQVTSVLISLDCTEAVVAEAASKNCNLIISHHPIVFTSLKSLTGANYVERTVISAIKNEIAIFAIHTNLDNVNHGVNSKICSLLGLSNTHILRPKQDLQKLEIIVPADSAEAVLKAIHNAGAGKVGNYENCSFSVEGEGRFKPNSDANPSIGQIGKNEKIAENIITVLVPSHLSAKVLATAKEAHPYEEMAYFLSSLNNLNLEIGSGMVGKIDRELSLHSFLDKLKIQLNLKVIKHTKDVGKPIKTVAVCGGSGSFLLKDAIRQGADIFITSDFKYHEYFDAENSIVVADIGHYESEVFTKELLVEILQENFTNFALNLSEIDTNPIRYY